MNPTQRMARLLTRRPARSYALPVAALSLALGVWLAPNVAGGAWRWLLLALALLLWAALRLSRLHLTPALALGMVFLGLMTAQARLSPVLPPPGRAEVHGFVYGAPVLRESDRLSFTLCEVSLNGERAEGMAYATVNTYGDDALPTLFDGAEIVCTANVYHPEGKSGPNDFDFRLYLLQNGMRFGLSGVRGTRVLNDPSTAPWRDTAWHIRDTAAKGLRAVMGEEARLAVALLLGVRDGMREEEIAAFQETGIAHVMSVSGLHVGILSMLLSLVMDRLRVSKRWRLPALALLLAGYGWLTGFSPATVRAAVMLTLANGAYALGRRPDPAVLLSAAMLVVLFIDPLQLFAAGFVLSFSAMGGILLLMPPLRNAAQRLIGRAARDGVPTARCARRGRVRRALDRATDAVCFSIAAQLGVLLPTAVYFHHLPLYGVFINCLIVPLTGALVPLCLLALLCSPVPGLGVVVGALARIGCAAMLELARLVSELPSATVRVPSAPMAILCGAAFAAVLISRYFRGGWRARTLSLLLTAALAFAGVWWTRPADLRYVQLDVGDADAALIVDGHTTLAIDAGDSGRELAQYLLAEGRDLDALVLTHLHSDHALGAETLLESGIRVGAVYLPPDAERQLVDAKARAALTALADSGVPIRTLVAGDELRYNRVSLRALWPVKGHTRTGHDPNDYPLVTLIDFAGYRILSASDLMGGYEAYCAERCDVLKVAHHGSATSTGDAFLAAASPRLALVSCREGDSTPSDATLARLSAHDVATLRTDDAGDITLTVEGGRLIVTTYKGQGRTGE